MTTLLVSISLAYGVDRIRPHIPFAREHRIPPKKIEKSIPFLPAKGEYGPVADALSSERRISFQFNATSRSTLLLHFTPGNIQPSDQLVIELNGNPIGFAPVCSGRWGIEERTLLPARQLHFGINEIAFVMRDHGGRWGVRSIYLTEIRSEESEAADPQYLLDLSERLFRERHAVPGHILRAKQTVDRAMAEFKVKRLSIPKRAVMLKRQISEEERSMFLRLQAEAQGAIRQKEESRARKAYERILMELIEPTDPRRIEINHALAELDSQ